MTPHRPPSDPTGPAHAARVVRTAETLAIGTELLLGEIHDTNGAWLASELAGRGVDVYWSVRVGDNRARIRDALRSALARSDLVVTSGGLGPTEDDLTREAIADLLGETPTVDPGLERDLRERFARTGRPMPDRNLKQAWLVPSARALPNPRGTAPGWCVRTERAGAAKWIVALPGPPRELMRMAAHEAFPRLPLPSSRLWTTTLKTLDIGESELADRLGDLALGGNPSVATYARADGVHVRVAAKASDAAAARALGEPVAAELARLLGDAIWGRDGDTLEGGVIAALAARDLRLAIAESATAGTLTARLAALPDAGERVMGCVVPWATIATNMPGASPAAGPGAKTDGVARYVRRFFAADAAIAVGELRPEGDGGALVHLALVGVTGDHRRTVRLPEADGAHARDRIALAALSLLRRGLPGA